MIKLVAIDMDGTLLSDEKTISEYTKEVISQANQKGVRIVIATGRPLGGIKNTLAQLSLNTNNDYVIGFNGALVQNVITEEIVAREILHGEDLHNLYEVSKQIGVNIHAFAKDGTCITPKLSEYTEYEGKMNDIPLAEVDFSKIPKDAEISKIMLIDPEPILTPAIQKLSKELYDKYTVVRSAPFYLEFLNKNANKGVGVEQLAKYLGINQDEVMAIGDAGNDLHMIKYAGIGVAMGNAIDEIKQIAQYITKTNNEDGVAHAIKKFVL
ncbi:MAG: HAD family hydrolase [Epulopiscium sp. Nuni2H_MBin003]|nr:MAG: HAD family hydrolase [Epulopiscium sp. Nuni2H_MBin003]